VNILMIDDDPLVVDSVDLLFSMRWPEVNFMSASEGRPGIQMAQIVKPDVIILDMGLPDIGGLEALRLIREFSQVPILVLTVTSQSSVKTRAIEFGANDYVVKPFAPNDLLNRLKALVQSS